MRIETAFITSEGGRRYNEDSVRILCDDALCAVTVADGLGGHGGGEIASRIAADYIVNTFAAKPLMTSEYIKGLFEEANGEVIKSHTSSNKMKSTCVSLFIKGDTALWGHAGDSRLYLFKRGEIEFQTLDHSVSQMAVMAGEITKEQIRGHPDRNKVLRALGIDGGNFKCEISAPFPLEKGHAFLLCTDGFWEYVFETEMEKALSKSSSPFEWLDRMVKKLTARAKRGNDNYSAAAVFVE